MTPEQILQGLLQGPAPAQRQVSHPALALQAAHRRLQRCHSEARDTT